MCPYMNIGIKFNVNLKYNKEKVHKVVDKLTDIHIFLRSNLELDDNQIFYEERKKSAIIFEEKKQDSMYIDDYTEIMTSYWNVFKQGLLKIFIYPHENNFTVLFVAHHLLGDGRSIMQLVEEFVMLYDCKNFDDERFCDNGRLIQRKDDFPKNSDLFGFSKFYINYLNKKWEKESKRFYEEEYRQFFYKFVDKNPINFEFTKLHPNRLTQIKKKCRENCVSVNSAIVSATSQKININKIGIAADIRDKIKCYQKGTIGNFATGLSISCKGNNKDIYKRAKKIDNRVKKKLKNNRKLMLILSCYLNMSETLIDAMVAASFGAFDSKAAKLAGAMLSYDKRNGIGITNLGKYDIANVADVVFIPPVSPANIETLGVLTVNNEMIICSSFCENLISKEIVKRQLKDITISL